MYVTPDFETATLVVHLGPVTLHVRVDDAQIFANLLRRPPSCGLVWPDALDPACGARLRLCEGGTEVSNASTGDSTWISWTVAVDIAGEITGGLGQLKLARVAG